jgi:hypothetical protein
MPSLNPEWTMGFIFGGILLLLLAAVFEALWEFGRQVKPELRPAFLESGWKHIILVVWIILLLIGGALLFWALPLLGLIAIVVFWLLLPISIGSRVRKRFLPPWDDLKSKLEKQGYTERSYWRRGDWWKAGSKTKDESGSQSKSGK